MSDDLHRDDRILGTALSRAVASQAARETPFESSRLAQRLGGRARSFPFGALAAAAGMVLVVFFGAFLLTRQGPPAEQPPPGATDPAQATPGPIAESPDRDRIWVYFARDQLPPVGAFISGIFDDRSAEQRIGSRISELHRASADEVPAVASNPTARLGSTQPSPTGTTSRSFGYSLRVDGDLATIEFEAGSFEDIRGSAMTIALVQQLVYTVTEEPGVRRVRIIEQGKDTATIDQLVLDTPLTREDVHGYAFAGAQSIDGVEGGPLMDLVSATPLVEEPVPGLTRITIELRPQSGDEPRPFTRFTARLEPAADALDPAARWQIGVTLPDAVWPATGPRLYSERIDLSPVRSISAGPLGAQGVGLAIRVDDARPWRAAISHLQYSPCGTDCVRVRLVIEIGGHPQAVSDSISVHTPAPGDTVDRVFGVTGLARAFEANVVWRLLDSSGREVAMDHTTATLGTSAVWGEFSTKVTVPGGVSGNVTLEVFWPSPKDGEDVGLVRIPLTVR